MDTRDFKTRSEFISKKMPRINGNNQYKGKTIVAIDDGYSSVKGISPNKVFCFPSYVKKVKGMEAISKVRDEDIQFRDNKTGEVWFVGQAASSLMDQVDVASTTDTSIYTRYRYQTELYKVTMIAGLCVGLVGTAKDNEVFLQTGLPAEYKTRDEKALVDALVGSYDVSIKIGNRDWERFSFALDKEHIDVMEQPKGTLCSVAYKDGELTDIGKDVMMSSSVILDVGFGTEDIFSVKRGYKIPPKTYGDTGMRAVFEGVLDKLSESHPIDTKIFELQKYLEDGKITYYDNSVGEFNSVHFEGVLEDVNNALCEKSLKRLMQDNDNLLDYNYLIVTGGTGESRYENIKKFFENNPRLKVLPGNYNTPDLSFVYSNVVGYYMFRYAKLVSELKKSGAM